MTTTLSINYTKVAQEFKEALASAIDGLVKAGEVYVRAIDIDPTVAERLQEEFKDVVPAQAWAQFEALGRKHIHPQLVLGGMSDVRKSNMIKGLPYSVQSRVFDDEKFELLVSGGDTLCRRTRRDARRGCIDGAPAGQPLVDRRPLGDRTGAADGNLVHSSRVAPGESRGTGGWRSGADAG